MTISRRKFLHSTMAASAVLASPAISTRYAFGADDPIRVGSLLDQSGAIASSGVTMVAAIQLAIDEINEAGGLLGRPLELIQYDTQSNIQLYSQYAQQLALKDRVDVVHGGITSASREAIRPTFDRFQVLYFYNVLYEGGVCDRNVFCTGTTPAQTVEKLVPFAMKNSGKKAYILAADYNYGQITAKWMTKYMRDNGGEILSVDFFPLDVTNFGPTISKIQAAKPDLILSALVGGNHVSFYRQWESAGMKGQIPIASTTFGLVNEPSTVDASVSKDIYGCYGYYEELETPESTAFVDKLKSRWAEIPYISELTATTYEGVYLWAEGVKKAGTLDRMKVIEALESGISYKGPSGEVTLDGPTHHTVRNAYLAQVQDRKWNVLETFQDVQPSDTAMVCNLAENPNDNQQYVIDIDS
ncbi:urea ABC transporter substrate-binding protein [Jiella marina]|uniref:urea ABC transporter substrate-binding protein n=1 Tax=Jiella sp. LLJ827 TaxID=2917712 RepID=UPI002100D132|nr:ABC transporter substrate-binding protein [Jiella sp. LLJ827]MCQ0988695.1 transporter substrate-binding protein [Jiella sp. LLJ827]